MNVLYGVVGEGMGHATRSRVVVEHLLRAGHTLRIIVSGRAHQFLRQRLQGRERVEVFEVEGLNLVYEDNEVQRRRSVRTNLEALVPGYQRNLTAYRHLIGDFHPELVISDFESLAWGFARRHDIPVISIDNMQIINRCRHDDWITDHRCLDFQLARMAVKAKLPGCDHYLVSSFFFPPVRKKYTTLLPPILRAEVLGATREPGEHILVYQTAATNQALIPLLKTLPHAFRVYGLNQEGRDENVTTRAFSEAGFIEDLRTARGVIASGGYSLMGEAVHLQVPMLAVPLVGQYEQEVNARYLQALGYGKRAASLSEEEVVGFLEQLDAFQQALEGYSPQPMDMLTGCVDELVRRTALGERRIPTLESPSLGDRYS